MNPKKKIHEDWLEVKAARDEAWVRIDKDPCHPYRKQLIQEWKELFDKEVKLYNQLTR